jgi:hypothetical protein
MKQWHIKTTTPLRKICLIFLLKSLSSQRTHVCDDQEKQNILIALNIRLIVADFKKILKILRFLFPAVGGKLELRLTGVE